MNYAEFLKNKTVIDRSQGIEKDYPLNPLMFPFQAACTRHALRRGRETLAEGCGMGKTFQELEYARVVHEHTNKNVLIAAPLAVASQTVAEGKKFGIDVKYCRHKSEIKKGIVITNYEMLEHFDANDFIGLVGDEISIIKNYAGKTKNQIISKFALTPFRLGASATPAPNDYMELGCHSEFMGVLRRSEMLAQFFTHDGGDTATWRLKGWGEEAFWRWLAEWCIAIRKPSDIGFSDEGYILPPLVKHRHVIDMGARDGYLLPMLAKSLQEQRAVKRQSIEQRVDACLEIVNSNDEQWIIFGELNDECDALEKYANGSVQVAGRDDIETKESRLNQFLSGGARVLVSKPSICGYGLNLQCAHNIAFPSLSHSWEDQYQAICRCLRFGQKHEVNVHYFMMDVESPILDNINRKERESELMIGNMIAHMAERMKAELGVTKRQALEYAPEKKLEVPSWL